MKDLEESISKSYHGQLNELTESLEATKKELIDANKASAKEKNANEDLKEKLSVALQSRTEANEIIESQKASMAKLQIQLDEERDQRREEREKAAADLKAAVQKVQSEAHEESERLSDAASKRERVRQEVIHRRQESERESSSLVESLRPKLEEAIQKLVLSENKVRQLEALLFEERVASDLRKKRIDEVDIEISQMRRELDKEKAAWEEAWAKISALALEINEIVRDLETKKQRLRGAKERIMLRETQLRSFYSTTEEIQMLLAKQQEQLKTMQRTLKDEEDYGNVSLDVSLTSQRGPITSAHRFDPFNAGETSSYVVSATDKHVCDIRSQDDKNTQVAVFPNDDAMVKDGFGSDIDGVGTDPAFEGDDDGTERVLETESLGIDGDKNNDLNKLGNSAGGTTCFEDDASMQETEHQVPSRYEDSCHFNLNNQVEVMKTEEDERRAEGIRTQDLMTSEVAGSWANCTGPSVYGENESSNKDYEKDADAVNNGLSTQVAESDGSAAVIAIEMNLDHERVALCNIIGIIAPDVKEQFGSAADVGSVKKNTKVSFSDSETDGECVETSKNADGDGGVGCNVGVGSDETQADYQADENGGGDHIMYKDDDDDDDEYVTEADSIS